MSEDREEDKEETHIEKKRTTALKIIVDEKTCGSEDERRKFLAGLFDFPEYAIPEEVTSVHVTGPVPDVSFRLTSDILAILKNNNIDVATFTGYQELKTEAYRNGSWELDKRVNEVTGTSDKTYLHYRHSRSETTKAGIKIFYLHFELITPGKTKTEIKSVHKQNVCKFLNYLRMRKVPYTYDCEWSFEGNRACQL